jgi:hypothetical protein
MPDRPRLLNVRMTEAEMQMLRELAEQDGLSVSDTVRQLVRRGREELEVRLLNQGGHMKRLVKPGIRMGGPGGPLARMKRELDEKVSGRVAPAAKKEAQGKVTRRVAERVSRVRDGRTKSGR